jgi:ribosomal protein S12 methylthiotransferase accessory factor
MSVVVAVVGNGLLSELVHGELERLPGYEIVRRNDLKAELPEATSLVVVLQDGWFPAVQREAEMVMRKAGLSWIPGFVAFGEGVVGPLVHPGIPGCSLCADTRRLKAGRDRKEMWALHSRFAEQEAVSADAWASRTGLMHMSLLIAEEVRSALYGNRGDSEARVQLVDLNTLKSTRHVFLPDPLCPICGSLPDDCPDLARITLRPSPKTSVDSYRSRSMEELKQFLAHDYLDNRTGFLNGKIRDLTSTFADASVNLPLFTEDEATAGRTHSYARSELTAMLESLERYCGLSPRGKRSVVRNSYLNVQEQALNPLSVGVHTEEQYSRQNFPFQPFHPNRPLDWVWGYSLQQERPILVPELLAYYSMGCGDGFVFETSNGCALGGSLEEAIFYAMLEVLERDSFLLTWYAQLPLTRLDPFSVNDPELHGMIHRLEAVAGYEVMLYNSTMEHGIPSVWSIAKNKRTQGVNLICAAGAHPDPVRAAKSSIHELAGMLLVFDEKLEKNRETYERMLHDPYQVRRMEDHSMLYALPQAEERLRFLLDDPRPLRTFEEEFKPTAQHADLTDDLKDMLQALRKVHLDVIIVEQTTPELARNGLHCVKALIPGTLPMTFGYHLTRLTGLERVLNVPQQLGYAERALTNEQLNRHPHPFP